MGVHIYSGSLARFYTNDWENEIQRIARERGIEYQVSYSGDAPKWPTQTEARDHLDWMRGVLAERFGPSAGAWNDGLSEYQTIKLHAEGREAITLVAAHLHRPDLPMPSQMPATAHDDQAFAEAGKKGYLIGPIAAFDSSLIVPGVFDGVMLIESPIGEKVLVCSTGFLSAALNFVERDFWRGEVDPLGWVERGLAYARGSGTIRDVDGVRVEEPDEEPSDSLRANAEFAFGVYHSLLAFSKRHNTAIAIW